MPNRSSIDLASAARSPTSRFARIVEAIQLGPRWEEEVLSIIAVEDEVEKVRDGRQKVQERLRRLGRAYVDGVYDDDEYKRQKRDPGARA